MDKWPIHAERDDVEANIRKKSKYKKVGVLPTRI